MNREFQQDPGSVYSCIGKKLMLEKQQENENFGEHYGKEPEVETLEWNGLRMLLRQ